MAEEAKGRAWSAHAGAGRAGADGRPRPAAEAQRPQRRDRSRRSTACFSDISPDVRAMLIHGIGPHFSAGLDLERAFRARRIRGRAAFALLAPLLREDRIRAGSRRRRAEGRGRRRRAGARGGGACARRRAHGVLRPARGPARHFRRRRRLGAPAAADRRRAHGGHDADGPQLQRRGRRRPRLLAISDRGRRGPCQGPCRSPRRWRATRR